MAEAPLLLAAAGGCALLGMGWLALAMDHHWQQVHGGDGPSPPVRHGLRALGALALLASLALSLAADHPSMAALVWVMWLAAAALAVAMLLAARPRWARWLWPRRPAG